MRKKFIRTRYFTASRAETRYLTLLLVSMAVPAVFVGGCLYYLIFALMAEQLGIPESIAYHLMPVIDKINLTLLIGVPPLAVILIVWGVAVSHRVVGPIVRLENEIKHITESGNYSRRIHLRRNDELKPVANAINRLMDRLEGKHK